MASFIKVMCHSILLTAPGSLLGKVTLSQRRQRACSLSSTRNSFCPCCLRTNHYLHGSQLPTDASNITVMYWIIKWLNSKNLLTSFLNSWFSSNIIKLLTAHDAAWSTYTLCFVIVGAGGSMPWKSRASTFWHSYYCDTRDAFQITLQLGFLNYLILHCQSFQKTIYFIFLVNYIIKRIFLLLDILLLSRFQTCESCLFTSVLRTAFRKWLWNRSLVWWGQGQSYACWPWVLQAFTLLLFLEAARLSFFVYF